MSIDETSRINLVKMLGQYLIDNAEDVVPIRIDDLAKPDARVELIVRGIAHGNRTADRETN